MGLSRGDSYLLFRGLKGKLMLEWLAKFLGSFKIIATILPNEKGVLCRFGKYKRTYGPSIRFIFPFIDNLGIVTVAEQVEDLRCQSITTKDGKALLVSGKIRYRVTEPDLALFEVYDWDEALADEVLGVLATECMKRTFEECLDHLTLSREVEKTVRRQAKKWGLEVTGFTLTDMVVHRALRLEWNKALITSD